MNAYPDTAPELADDYTSIDGEVVDAPMADDRLLQMARLHGDVSHLLSEEELNKLGADAVADYEFDQGTISEWRSRVEEALDDAAQDNVVEKTFPWRGASNIKYPWLTLGARSFADRAMPAIVKGDEAVGVKVVGDKPEKPELPQLPPEAMQNPQVQAQLQQMMQGYQEAAKKWTDKNARAKRRKTYLNYVIFYKMPDWEGDVDAMLNHMPITGMAFKKVFYDASIKSTVSNYIHPLHFTVAMDTKTLKTCPRMTEDYPLYPYEVIQKQRQGIFLDTVLIAGMDEDSQKPRTILEQHRLHMFDDIDVAVPLIVTVDQESGKVLRLEAAFSEEDIEYANGGIGSGERPVSGAVSMGSDSVVEGVFDGGQGLPESTEGLPVGDGQKVAVLSIKRWVPYVKFPFLRDPKGRFYEVGFGHLLAPLSAVINAALNQLTDTGTAQAAGGGFIGSGLKLRGGQTDFYFEPGKYQTLPLSGQAIKDAIYDRPLPMPSPITFQLLELMMGAAKELTASKDVLTGDAPTTAPVGTTQMLIEQGLQSFTATYKRLYRSMREEFALIDECERRYGDPQEYLDVLDDPAADFEKDFDAKGHDVVPVSDPTVVTKMQSVAKAQYTLQVLESPMGQAAGADPKAVIMRVLEAGDIDDVASLWPSAAPEPNPMVLAELENKKADTALKLAEAKKAEADSMKTQADAIGLHADAEEAEARTRKHDADANRSNAQADHERAKTTGHHVSTIIAAHDATGSTYEPTPEGSPNERGLSNVAGESDDAMGIVGAGQVLGGSAGQVAGPVMDPGAAGPPAPDGVEVPVSGDAGPVPDGL